MNLFQAVILIGLLGNTVLGVLVFFSNPKRPANFAFVLLSIMVMLWFGAMYYSTLPFFENRIVFWIRQTSAWGVMLPFGVFVVQFAIIHSNIRLASCFYKLRYWFSACLAFFIFCHTPFFVRSAALPPESRMLAVPNYGWGFYVFIGFFVFVIISVILGFWKYSRSSSGVQRAELQFLQIGCAASLAIAVILLMASQLLNNQEIGIFLPLSVLVLDGFVAYGIATRRILAVSEVLQRVVSYILMALYLAAVYSLSVWGGRHVFRWFFSDPIYVTYFFSALITAFSVVPAHGWMQTVSHRLFASANLLNVNVVLEQAGQMFQEVSTEAGLMEKFSGLVAGAFGASQVRILRPAKEGLYVQAYPVPEPGEPLMLAAGSAIVGLLREEHEAFTVETLHRMRPTPEVSSALEEMESRAAALMIGSFMRREMKAVLLLSSRKSGRIYDLRDQRALQLLCDQFAVALENAQLYTAVQNGKIYNEILLDSLASGIVAVNADRVVTVFNQRAQKLTGLEERAVVDRPSAVLPSALAESLEALLSTQSGFRDRDLSIPNGEGAIPVRVSGSVFYSHTGGLLGALLVFNDMTLLKKMEEQIRRSDRLSSIGTLSAGMAHEIKNPLVTIKTFTQLLPQQYGDSDFRQTFFDLVGQEVMRIDTIVNRLLHFSRPAKAALEPVSLHEVIENSLRLVEQKLLQSEIVLQRDFRAKRYIIEADAEQLNQTLINLFLNAVHAMEKGGTLAVRTKNLNPSLDPVTGVQNGARIQLDIEDTGSGISPENLERIFDPFFTTKEDGVGLGLSVSYGIIQEHNGTIDVESGEGKGTVFHVRFPLLQPQERNDV